MCENLRENILEIRILYLYIQGRIYTSLIYLHELEIVVQDYGGSYTLSFYMYNTFVIPCQFTGARHKLSVFLLFVIHVSVFDHPNNDIFYSKLVIRK